MLSLAEKLRVTAAGALFTVFAGSPALADDAEIYRSSADVAGVQPNVLFVIDTSGSMDSNVVIPIYYDPTQTYTGSCINSRIYFSLDGNPPTCDTSTYFAAASNQCKAAMSALAAGGPGVWPASGATLEKVAQYRSRDFNGEGGNGTRWRTFSTTGKTGPVDCEADSGTHGATDTSTAKYISNSTTSSGGYSTDNANLWSNLTQRYQLYSANYLNYLSHPTSIVQTRFQIVRDVAINLASTLKGVNLGLMRYSWNARTNVADGGYVWVPVAPIATNRSTILKTLQPLGTDYGEGNTPLSETLYEAALYMQGKAAQFGKLDAKPGPVASGAQVNGTYISPLTNSCQNSYIVYLTDGLPTSDTDANDLIKTMIKPATCSGSGDGACTDELAYYLSHTDQSKPLTGEQFIKTYMIGFGDDVADGTAFLDKVADSGGTGEAYTATDAGTLTTALESIFEQIQRKGTTFVTPNVAINAFNRNQLSDDVYVSLFLPDSTEHWPGNLKKFKNRKGELVGQNGVVIDATGKFTDNAQDYWSSTADGEDITLGGAAGKLKTKAPADRNLFTFLSDLTQTPLLPKSSTAGGISDALIGTGTATDSCSKSCKDAINWARGYDITKLNADGNPSGPVAKPFIGDPLHGRIGTVTYGGTATLPDAVVFVPTNDGFLHAFRADTGVEMWAFIPPELLPRLPVLKDNPSTTTRGYGLDGDIKVLKYDKNQNGIVDSPDDFVWLFFGMRAGGNHYYALNVTDKAAPKMMWNIGPNTLPGVGQTWSPPAIGRVKVSNLNADKNKFVLIFGGGYDPRQENKEYAIDTVGNRIYMVDASTGTLLWYAGAESADGSPKLKLPEMNNSIPAPVSVIDSNGDGFTDRLYVGDMGGRVWRFDIFNGQAPEKLATGGVLARLGAGTSTSTVVNNPPQSTVRRFYNAPDVSQIQQGDDDPYYNIAIGSGYRGHPLNRETNDAFYSLRDKRPFAQMTANDWQNYTPITESDKGLIDISANPLTTPVTPAARGWMYHFNNTANPGEKVLSSSTTFNNVVYFNTYQPNDGAATSCYPVSNNRVYALYASSGKPAVDLNRDGKIDGSDVSKLLGFSSGIAGGVTVSVDYSGKTDDGTTTPPTSTTLPGGGVPMCRSGLEVIPCPPGTGANRTFWKRKDAK